MNFGSLSEGSVMLGELHGGTGALNCCLALPLSLSSVFGK